MNEDLSKIKIAVIGLGYVGLPLAIEFSKKYTVVAYDINKNRIQELLNGYDTTNELSKDEIISSNSISFVFETNKIAEANVFIITVPTPVNQNKHPDFEPLKNATTLVSKFIKKGSVVIFESTVYPGCTEEVCVPILENNSKLVYNKDFFIGYSPERINPGDKLHRLSDIKKITSGSNDETLNFVDSLYKSIINAGTFRASSISVAEAAKVIENTQRDVNIALINELALIFDKLKIDTLEVLEAAETKWNFLPFRPGLVGGHCIGVDPYYLTFKAMEVGHHPEVILSGRKINDSVGTFIADKTISELAMLGIGANNARITILGITFKENCPDLRNSQSFTIFQRLKEYNCQVNISDHYANNEQSKEIYNNDLVKINSICNQDAIILAVAHEQYSKLHIANWENMLEGSGVLIDVRSILDKEAFKDKKKIRHWRF